MSKQKLTSGEKKVVSLILGTLVMVLVRGAMYAVTNRAVSASDTSAKTASTPDASITTSGSTGRAAAKETPWYDESYTQECHADGLMLRVPESWHLDEDGCYYNANESRFVGAKYYDEALELDLIGLANDVIERFCDKEEWESIKVLEGPHVVDIGFEKNVSAVRFSAEVVHKEAGLLFTTVEYVKTRGKGYCLMGYAVPSDPDDAKLQFEYIFDNITLEDA